MAKSNIFRIHWKPTKAQAGTAIAIALLVVVGLGFVITAFTPLRNLVPGYPTASVRQEQARKDMVLDSLERCLYRWELYSENLRRVVTGEKPIQIDSMIRKAAQEYRDRTVDATDGFAADSTLREFVTEEEKFELSGKNRTFRIEGLHFFKPVSGTLSNRFEIAQHPYIDITAPEGSTVKSVLDGSVIYTEWNEVDNWSIIIQHQNGIISVYKHNQKLLKKTSDKVSAGTSIALLGAGADVSRTGTHLHFELWQDGTPLDPAAFINF